MEVTTERSGPELRKLYYSIGEVSDEASVPAHVLRYWETEFPQLKPKKGRNGNRMYQQRDIELIRRIKELLYDRKFTIAGARAELQQHKLKSDDSSDNLQDEIRQTLQEILDLLNTMSGRGAAR